MRRREARLALLFLRGDAPAKIGFASSRDARGEMGHEEHEGHKGAPGAQFSAAEARLRALGALCVKSPFWRRGLRPIGFVLASAAA